MGWYEEVALEAISEIIGETWLSVHAVSSGYESVVNLRRNLLACGKVGAGVGGDTPNNPTSNVMMFEGELMLVIEMPVLETFPP